MNEFDDIINLPRPYSKNHPPMPRSSRAVQFGAFRALTGHEEALSEEARLTDSWVDVSSEATEELNREMNKAKAIISDTPEVSVTYFVPDEKKIGGKYVKHKMNLRIIDDTIKLLTFTDGTKIPFSSILDFKLISKKK